MPPISTDQFTKYPQRVNRNELLCGGLCFFARTEEEEDGVPVLKCQSCGHELVSPKEPLSVFRPCDKPVTLDAFQRQEGIELPPLAEKYGNFGFAVLRHIARGIPLAPEWLIHSRHNVCTMMNNGSPCIKYIEKDEACAACGCNVNRDSGHLALNKLAWAESECPEGHWPKYEKGGEIPEATDDNHTNQDKETQRED